MTDVSVKEYGDALKQKAEYLIMKGFPKKILKLNELLEVSNFHRSDLSDFQKHLKIIVAAPSQASFLNEPKSKRARYDSSEPTDNNTITKRINSYPGGTAPSNNTLCDLIRVVKLHIRELVEDSTLLKMWITLLIPKIKDGNNYGVLIQKNILVEIQSVQAGTEALFDKITRYSLLRAKLVIKVAKYPYIDDYQRAMKELDEKYYHSLRQVLSKIHHHYCFLHDIIIKNFEKIKKSSSKIPSSSF